MVSNHFPSTFGNKYQWAVLAAISIGSAGINGSEIVISGSGGAPGAIYHVVTTTDVALPLLQWLPVATNVFDASGNFTFTNGITPANQLQFFRLRVP